MAFYQFPGSNFHDLNLDWLLQEMKKCIAEWQATQIEWSNTQTQWEELQTYVQNYFNNLDVSTEISNKINQMVADGSLLAVIQATVQTSSASAAAQWLQENVTQETGYVLDSTLTVNNAAANSKAVGNRFNAEVETDRLISKRLSVIDGELFFDANSFELGTIYVASYPFAYYNSTTRIRTKQNNKIYLPAGVIIGMRNPGYTFFIGYEADDDTHGYTTGRTAAYQTPKAGHYSIVVYKTTEEAITNINDYIEQIIISYPAPQYNPESVKKRIDTLMISESAYDMFEFGSINMSGSYPAYSDSTTRIRTLRQQYIHMRKNDMLIIDESIGIQWILSYYDMNGTYHPGGSWSAATAYSIPADGYYFFLFRLSSAEPAITDITDITKHIRFYKQFTRDKINYEIAKYRNYGIFVRGIAHRGLSSRYPENTEIAVKMAAKYGFDCVETDVRYTSDGVPVCLHDEAINRTARNADGTTITDTINISSITYAQAEEYDFGVWKNPMFAGAKIMTFEQYIVLCKKLGVMAYVELKVSNTDPLVAIVKKYGMQKYVTWISFNLGLLSEIKTALPNARLGFVLESLTSANITQAQTLKTATNEVFIDLLVSSATTANVNMLIENDIPCEVYTLDVMEQFHTVNKYVTGITSNSIPAQVNYRNHALTGFMTWMMEMIEDF